MSLVDKCNITILLLHITYYDQLHSAVEFKKTENPPCRHVRKADEEEEEETSNSLTAVWWVIFVT